jgi:hypothetical protein
MVRKTPKGRVVFLLSPAHCGGRRAQILMREGASFALALALRQPEGVPLGEAFAFLSGLYFRGKLAYARAFGRPPRGMARALVITPTRGLVDAEERIGVADLREFGSVDIREDDPRYRGPLERDAAALARALPASAKAVLLGSIASDKYVPVLLEHLGDRLHFPGDFVGRGDMSRGGLMLRCVLEARELDTRPVAGAERRGARPAKLAPKKGVLKAFLP